ncbi:hypothetical protein [Pikeienuella sp. HZG-20]|uniref:hypothetical protein n=1 Tax=Paludibacillus litoralis TaxID=3133267 RepID=UPI0030EE06E3
MADALTIAKGAVEDIGRRLRLIGSDRGASLRTRVDELVMSDLPDAALRHRLWYGLSKGLATSTSTPFSTRSGRASAASMAVRTSERLSPAHVKRRASGGQKTIEGDGRSELERRAARLWARTRDSFAGVKPMPFPQLVEEEFLDFLADGQTLETIAQSAEPEAAEALRRAHAAAQVALATGGGWAAFAAIAGSAGFAPYLLAAQASAWIPLVSGPGLVSLLAVVVNPVTLFVGLGALAWWGAAHSANAVRSQMAARLCVLLAMRGAKGAAQGLDIFVGDMRQLADAPETHLAHMDSEDLHFHWRKAAFIRTRRSRAMQVPAGAPPAPWNVQREWAFAKTAKPSATDRLNIADGLAITALTAGEMLWHAAAIDRNVLMAADFSRSADLGDPIAFAAAAGNFAVEGAGYSLRGYTAERFVMDRLIADGHDVALAQASNTPGLDLLVDGAPVQVKCGVNLSLLKEHFAKYPGIPVIANEELVDEAAQCGADWAKLVGTVPGFDIAAIEEDVAGALAHAAGLAGPDILFFAFSAGAIRGGVGVWRGEIALDDLPAWLVIDGAARGMLGLIGGHGGAWIGLVAIGPAGALILGPIAACAALMGAGAVRERVTRALMRNWHRELLALAETLHRAVTATLERRIEGLERRYEELHELAKGQNAKLLDWMCDRADDDLIAAIEARADTTEPPRTEALALELVVEAARLAPGDAETLRARKRIERYLENRPKLSDVAFPTRRAVAPGGDVSAKVTPSPE